MSSTRAGGEAGRVCRSVRRGPAKSSCDKAVGVSRRRCGGGARAEPGRWLLVRRGPSCWPVRFRLVAGGGMSGGDGWRRGG